MDKLEMIEVQSLIREYFFSDILYEKEIQEIIDVHGFGFKVELGKDKMFLNKEIVFTNTQTNEVSRLYMSGLDLKSVSHDENFDKLMLQFGYWNGYTSWKSIFDIFDEFIKELAYNEFVSTDISIPLITYCKNFVCEIPFGDNPQIEAVPSELSKTSFADGYDITIYNNDKSEKMSIVDVLDDTFRIFIEPTKSPFLFEFLKFFNTKHLVIVDEPTTKYFDNED